MEPWHYDTVEDLDQSIVDRLRRFPREPDILVYSVRIVAAAILRSWLKVYHRVRLVIGESRRYSHLKRGKHAAVQICQDLRDAIVALAAGESSK